MNDKKDNDDKDSKEFRSDFAWRNEVSEAYEEWISKGEWSHFITINYNIWRSSTSGKKVYDNKTNTMIWNKKMYYKESI